MARLICVAHSPKPGFPCSSRLLGMPFPAAQNTSSPLDPGRALSGWGPPLSRLARALGRLLLAFGLRSFLARVARAAAECEAPQRCAGRLKRLWALASVSLVAGLRDPGGARRALRIRSPRRPRQHLQPRWLVGACPRGGRRPRCRLLSCSCLGRARAVAGFSSRRAPACSMGASDSRILAGKVVRTRIRGTTPADSTYIARAVGCRGGATVR